MNIYILFSFFFLAMTVATSSPVDPGRILVNRPTDVHGGRVRRSDQAVKGGFVRVPLSRSDYPYPSLRKGEYICGNKVCMLKPGEKPRLCEGCQYPL